jgi:hypothetical protein
LIAVLMAGSPSHSSATLVAEVGTTWISPVCSAGEQGDGRAEKCRPSVAAKSVPGTPGTTTYTVRPKDARLACELSGRLTGIRVQDAPAAEPVRHRYYSGGL